MSTYVVTGAARGLGYEFVNHLSAVEGNIVFAIVRNKVTATMLYDLNRSNVHIIQADITDHSAVETAAQTVERITGGSLDVLINNAGKTDSVRRNLSIDKYPSNESLANGLRASFEVEVVGTAVVTNTFLPLVLNGKAKKVMTISGGMGDLDLTLASQWRFFGPGAVAKAGQNMLVAKYAASLKSQGVTFLAISPGLIESGVKGEPSPEDAEMAKEFQSSIGRLYPDWAGPISPTQSVQMVLDVLNKVTLEDSGLFMSHHGNKQWL